MIIKFDNPSTGEEEYLAHGMVETSKKKESARALDKDTVTSCALFTVIAAHEELKNAVLCEKHEKRGRLRCFDRKLLHLTREEAWAYAEGMAAKLGDFPLSSNPYCSGDLSSNWTFGYFDSVEKSDVNNGNFRSYGVFKVKDLQDVYAVRFFWEEEV